MTKIRSRRANSMAWGQKSEEKCLFQVSMAKGGVYGRTDGRTSGNSALCPTGHWPFGAAAQKEGRIF